MKGKSSTRDKQLRQHLAQEAARLVAEGCSRDYLALKQKAAARLGISDRHLMPSNQEIEQALFEYQQLFQTKDQEQELRRLRQVAVNAMEMLASFEPRLVGPVLSGTATNSDGVSLHVFVDPPEEIQFFLMDRGIPYREGQRRLRIGVDDARIHPSWSFSAEQVDIELIVFPVDGIRTAPRSPVDGRPMQRAGLRAVQRLLDQVFD